MQQKEKKYFADNSGRLNADDASFAIGLNEWVNAENVRSGTTDDGVTGVIESIGGTLQISQPQPSINFVTIGSADDTENGIICYLKFNTTGNQDKIVTYDINTNTEYDTLLSSQINGGLNFEKNSIIHSCRIVNNMLYWIDSTTNQPRKINIYSAIKANNPSYNTEAEPYVFPLNFSEITLIKPPPNLSPNIQKAIDAGFLNNFIANESFEFSFQYSYYDNEITVPSAYSQSTRLNKVTDTENYVAITMDVLEQIPSTVRIVNLIARYGNSNSAKIIKQWDKDIATENTEIQNHNNGTQVLTFDFYGNITGQFIAEDDVIRPFDNVPIYSEAMEFAKNRIFLGNNTEGYDNPSETSLTLTNFNIVIGLASLSKPLFSFQHRRFDNAGLPPGHTIYAYSGWYVFLTEIYPQGFYAITSTETFTPNVCPYPPLPTPPITIGLAGIAFRGSTQQEAISSVRPGTNKILWCSQTVLSTANTVAITGLSVQTYDVFKSDSQYKVGVVFYDFAMRKCGVVTNDGLFFEIGSRDYSFTTATNGVIWNLSNANALTEIPDWAYYYSVVRTLNQRTRFFVQSFTNAAKYAVKDANGVYTFNSDTYVTATVGIALNTAALSQSGLGYQFTERDSCILVKANPFSTTIYNLPVIGQQGNYIILKPQDIGSLTNIKFVYEIYSPYFTSEQEPFFEIGQIYRILNPTTIYRTYETVSDIFIPDSYVLTRNYINFTYFAEAMSPNDLFYKKWYNDGGKVNFITKLGQTVKTRYLSFSDVFIPNTSINGLSTFRLGNQDNVPEDCGSISKLILTSKVQGDGTVMLAICTSETNSIYLGETQILDSSGGNQFLSVSKGVIGTIQTLKGSFGTKNPESVCSLRGLVFFYDRDNAKFIQYSSNGLFPISNYKMTRFWKQFSDTYKSLTTGQIESLGARPFVFTTIDPHHNELLISIPKLLNIPPKGYTLDYPSMVYPFDIWDGQGKTIVYKIDDSQSKWTGSYNFNPEYFITLQDNLYSFVNGNMYLHNQSENPCKFYGVQYNSKIMFVSNIMPQTPKSYNIISVESNLVPLFTYFYNNYPYQQASDLVDYEFKELEGVFYSTIKRNKIQPTATGYVTNTLLTGEKMRNVAMFILLEFSIKNVSLGLKFVNIDFTLSKGHKT